MRDAFRLEPLEPRVLLSADPVISGAHALLMPAGDPDAPVAGAYDPDRPDAPMTSLPPAALAALRHAAAPSLAQTFAVDATAFDAAQLAQRSAFIDGTLTVAANERLGGSGTLALDLRVDGVLAPGYSPGTQNLPSLTVGAGGTLEIEIAGSAPGTGYDVINVAGLASLDGTLAVSLLDGYRPADGTVFEFLNAGSISGSFAAGTGLIDAGGGLFFELRQTADADLELVARTLGDSTGFVLDLLTLGANLSNDAAALLDRAGEWLNFDYFQDNTSFSLAGTLDLGQGVSLSGAMTVGYTAGVLLEVGGKAQPFDLWKIGVADGSGTLGADASDPSAPGVSFSDIDFGLLFVDAATPGSDLGWLLAEGRAGGLSIVGGSDLSISATDLALEFSLGLGQRGGVPNDSGLNLSQQVQTLTVGGTSFRFDGDGSLGEYASLSGTAMLSAGSALTLQGSIGVASSAQGLTVIGQDIAVRLQAGALTLGLDEADFGLLVLPGAGSTYALEATASGFFVDGGGFASVAADAAVLRLNTTGVVQTGTVLQAGALAHTFGTLAAVDMPAVSVTNLRADIGGVFRIGGSFAFERDADSGGIEVLASNAGIWLTAGDVEAGVRSATVAMQMDATTGDVAVIDARGTLSVQAGGALRLAAWGDAADIVASAALQSGGAASLLAGRDIDLAAAWQAGGTASAEAGRDLRLAAPLTIADADAWLAAGGSAMLGDVDLGTGGLALSAASLSASGLVQAAAAAIDVTGAVGSAATPVDLSVGSLALRAGGDAFEHNAGALALATVAPEVTRVEADGASTALNWTGPGGLQVGGVAVLIADGGLGLDVASAIGGGRLEAAAGSLALDAALDSDAALSLLASADIALSAGIAATGDASVDLQAGGRLLMTDAAVVSAEQGGLRLAAVGTMTLGALTTEGAVSLSARSIADAGTSDLDIRAQTLRVFTTGGGTTEGFGSGARPIQIQVDTFAADVAGIGAGGLFAIEADGVTVGSVGALQVSRIGVDGVAAALTDAALAGLRSAGNVVLPSLAGDLRIAGADEDGVGLRAGGNLRLEALDGDLHTTAALRSGAGHATLLASGGLSLGGDLVLERAGRTIDVDAGGDVTQAVGTRIATAGGDLRIAAGGSLALDFASAGSGRISLLVADVSDAGADDAVDLLASGLRLVSADGIGSEDQRLQTQASTVSARAAGGGIWLQEADAIRVGDVTATVQRVGLNGTVSALVDAVQSDLVTTADDGSVALATRNGDIDLLDGTAPADGRSVVAHGSGRILLDVQGVGAVLDAAGNVLAQPGPLVLDSGLRIQGVLDWTAGVGGVAGDGAITIAGAVDGNPGSPADSLLLRADGAVNIAGPIGATAALQDLRIEGATDVTLGSTVTLTGDLRIAASGVVRIDGDVLLSGGSLEIVGASEVVLAGVSLGSGDVRIGTDRLTLTGRLAGASDALLWLSAAGDGAIGYGGDDGALRVDAALLSRLDGFGRLQIGDTDTAFVRMAAGSTLDTGGRQLTLQAAGDIGVSSIVAGDAGVVLASSAGTIGEVGDDAAADVQAAWLTMRGRGPELGAGASSVAAALEVASTRVDIDAGDGVVLRDSAPDGSVRYNLLTDGRLFQQLVAGADVQREASGPAPMDPAEVAARLQALRAGDAASGAAGDAQGLDWLRRPLALDPREAPALPAMTAAPLHDGGWLAQRLLAAPWADAEAPQGLADAGIVPARVELWIDPLAL